MQPQDDDFPYKSDDPSLAPIEREEASDVMTSQQADDIKAVLRVAIGSALNGSDALIARVRRIQAMQQPVEPGAVPIDANETPQDHLRYLLLGLLFELPDVFQRGLNSTGKASSKVYDLLSRLLSPLNNSPLFSPVKESYSQAASRGEKIIDRLVMKGRIEEYNSRQVLQEKAVNDLLNELVEYLVVKVKVQEIIEQQGTAMAGDVIGDFQKESANVDTLIESKLKSIFRKQPPTEHIPPPPTLTTPPPEPPPPTPVPPPADPAAPPTTPDEGGLS